MRRRSTGRRLLLWLAVLIPMMLLVSFGVTSEWLWATAQRQPIFESAETKLTGRAASCVNPGVAAACMNIEAMDGTGGRRGWRSASEGAVGAPFPEPRSYLAPAEAATYDTWTVWSQKPAGLDHLLPSLDYFSLGKTQPFLGDVNQPGVIERLIKARSYRGEIIQFQMAGLNHDTLDIGLNLAFNLRDLGYDHWVVHGGRDNVTCVALLEAMPDAGCIWDTVFEAPGPGMKAFSTAGFSPKHVLWWMRWWTVARLLRFGLNVAQWDVDLAIMDDFYKYFKSDIMKGMNWVCGCESDCGRLFCNGGTNYIQNIAPDGPAMWAVWQIVEREARAMEDWEAYKGVTEPNSAVMDQITQNAVLTSARIGIEVAHGSLDRLQNWNAAFQLRDRSRVDAVQVPAPPEWAERFDITDVRSFRANLTIPSDALPDGFKSIFLAPRGPFATRLLERLQTESGAPPFDEASVPLDKRKEVAPAELWQVENWLISTFIDGYWGGSWVGRKPPRAVVAHEVMGRSHYERPYAWKVLGWYHWKVDDVSSQMRGGLLPYRTSTLETPMPRVLLYTPALMLRGITQEEHSEMMYNLVLAAVLSGRHLVLPPVDCGSPWLLDSINHPENRNCSVPSTRSCWWHGHMWFLSGMPWETFPVVDELYPEPRDACQSWRTFNDQCWLKLMLYMDFKHMMTRRLPENSTASVTPSAANTLWHDALDPLGPPPPYPNVVRQVTAADLATQLASFGDQHAVYLNSVPHIRGAGAEEARRKVSEAGAGWLGVHRSETDTPLAERARRYIYECAETHELAGFGITHDVLQTLTQWAEQGLTA